MGAINSKYFAVYDTFGGLFQKEEEFSLIVKSEERRAVHLSLKWVHLQEETKQPLCKNNVFFYNPFPWYVSINIEKDENQNNKNN